MNAVRAVMARLPFTICPTAVSLGGTGGVGVVFMPVTIWQLGKTHCMHSEQCG